MNNHKPEYDLVFITQSRWDDVSSTSYSLAQEFARTNRVFYVDKPYTWLDLLRYRKNPNIKRRLPYYFTGRKQCNKAPGLPEKFTWVVSFLAFPINWLPKGRIYNFFLAYQQWRMERTLRRLCRKCHVKNYILFNSFNPYFSLDLPDDIKPAIKIYQSVDSMQAAAYLAKHGTYLEEHIAKEADLLLATAKQIVKNFTEKGFHIRYLPNAANIDHFKNIYFAETEKPAEFNQPGKKVIGYIGSIDFRTNYGLLRKLALHNKDNIIMLIGPVHKVNNNEGIDTLPNVIFTGSKPMRDLPYYAKSLDCAIIPFEHNEFTKSIYPLKINEYLGAGRPVVTTRFSDEMEDFRTIAHVTDDEEEFIAFVDKALKENTKEKELERIRFSENNSWAKRAEQFWNIVEEELLVKR